MINQIPINVFLNDLDHIILITAVLMKINHMDFAQIFS